MSTIYVAYFSGQTDTGIAAVTAGVTAMPIRSPVINIIYIYVFH